MLWCSEAAAPPSEMSRSRRPRRSARGCARAATRFAWSRSEPTGCGARPATRCSCRPGRGLPGCDVVFPVLHGPFGEDGTVQGLLEMPRCAVRRRRRARLGPVHGQGHLQAPDGARGHPPGRLPGVRRRSGRRARGGAGRLAALGLPVFVKPARLGSSVGIAPRRERGRAAGGLEPAFAHDSLAIVEAIASRASRSSARCSGNDEPVASRARRDPARRGRAGWYDYEAKYTPGGMELIVPARVPDAVRERVR